MAALLTLGVIILPMAPFGKALAANEYTELAPCSLAFNSTSNLLKNEAGESSGNRQYIFSASDFGERFQIAGSGLGMSFDSSHQKINLNFKHRWRSDNGIRDVSLEFTFSSKSGTNYSYRNTKVTTVYRGSTTTTTGNSDNPVLTILKAPKQIDFNASGHVDFFLALGDTTNSPNDNVYYLNCTAAPDGEAEPPPLPDPDDGGGAGGTPTSGSTAAPTAPSAPSVPDLWLDMQNCRNPESAVNGPNGFVVTKIGFNTNSPDDPNNGKTMTVLATKTVNGATETINTPFVYDETPGKNSATSTKLYYGINNVAVNKIYAVIDLTSAAKLSIIKEATTPASAWKPWMDDLTQMNMRLNCKYPISADLSAESMDNSGPDGKPRITVAGDPTLGRPDMRFELGRLVVTGGAATTDNNSFYFLYNKSLGAIGSSDVFENRYKHMAIRLDMSPGPKLVQVFYGDIRNPGDDSKEGIAGYGGGWSANVFYGWGFRVGNELIGKSVADYVYRKKDPNDNSKCSDTVVGPETNPTTAAPDWDSLDGGSTPPRECLILNGINIGDNASKTPIGWLKHWGIPTTKSSITDALGETEDIGPCQVIKVGTLTAFSPRGLVTLLNRSLCEVAYFVYSVGQGLAAKGKEILEQSLSLHS